MKRKIIPAAILFIIFGFLALLAAYNLDCILQFELNRCSASPAVALGGVLETTSVFQLFLIIWLSGCLLLAWMLFGQVFVNYKSEMIWVTPHIQIPAADGQGQYGTAKFLSSKQYSQYWEVVSVDESSPRLQKLIEEGVHEKSEVVRD